MWNLNNWKLILDWKMSGEAIGIMDGAFFVGRGELLAWINEFLGVWITSLLSSIVKCD